MLPFRRLQSIIPIITLLLLWAPCPGHAFPVSKVEPVPRADANSKLAHEQLLAKRSQGQIDLYFVGDSITRRWGCSDPQYAHLYAHWIKSFHGWNAANFGWGSDKVQNILWRLENGELENVHPKVVVLLAGTNNLNTNSIAGPGADASVVEVVSGIEAILSSVKRQAPRTKIILMGVFPRDSGAEGRRLTTTLKRINRQLAELARRKRIDFLDVTEKLSRKDGSILPGMMDDGVHLTVQGYQVWTDALHPLLKRYLGKKSDRDLAPPPTGDPRSISPQR